MQSNYLNQSNQSTSNSFPQQSSSNFYSNNHQQQQNNSNNSPQQFGNGSVNSNNGMNQSQQQQQQQQQWGNGSPSMRGGGGGNQINQNNNNFNNSPFGNQAQFGAGQSQSGPLPSAFGEKAKKNYLPGYLSGGAMGQSEATPPQHDDSRTWDSPGSRASISGSPIARFGNQSLFGNRDGTPSRSPQTNLYTQQPRTTAYRPELEEDAPPVESLSEFDVGNDSMMSQSSEAAYDNRRPALSTTNSSSPSKPSEQSSSSSSPGYSLHLFGFPSSSLQSVLEHFSQFGEIISSIPSTQGGNWVTITYASPTSAVRASRKNGTIIGGVLMIGVKIVDEEALKISLGTEGLGSGLFSTGTGNESNIGTRSSTPTRGPPSGVGKPVSVLKANSAFKSVAPTPPRRGFFASGAAGVNGTGGGGDPQAGLFAEKNRQALLAQGQQDSGKGVLGKVSDLVFGW